MTRAGLAIGHFWQMSEGPVASGGRSRAPPDLANPFPNHMEKESLGQVEHETGLHHSVRPPSDAGLSGVSRPIIGSVRIIELSVGLCCGFQHRDAECAGSRGHRHTESSMIRTLPRIVHNTPGSCASDGGCRKTKARRGSGLIVMAIMIQHVAVLHSQHRLINFHHAKSGPVCSEMPGLIFSPSPALVMTLQTDAPLSQMTGNEISGISLDGKIIIGAVMSVHMDKINPILNYKESPGPAICTTFMLDNYQWAQAVHFAVEEVNNSPDFLPNISLGFQIFDSCTVPQRTMSGTIQLLNGHGQPLPNYRCNQDTRLAAIIGHSSSRYSISLAHILGLYRYPQISFLATSSLLSNRIQFRSFFRTVPSDSFQSRGLAQLVLHYGWTWIGLVAMDDDYGQQGIQLVKRDVLQAGACVAFTETIVLSQKDRNAPHIARVVKDSTATVVVIFSTDIDLSFVLDEMLRQNVTGKILIASESWATSSFLSVNKYSRLLLGTIGFALHSGNMPGFGDFLNRINPSVVVGNQYIKIFWEQVFGCKFQDQTTPEVPSNSSLKECTGQESLKTIWNSYNDLSSLQITYNVYLAVHAVAKALSDLSKCKKGDGPFPNGTCADNENFKPWQLLYYLKKLHLNTSDGRQLFFDENGDPPAVYDIVNWQLSPEEKLQQVKVPVSVCGPSCPPGFRKADRKGEPLCCFQCIPCSSGERANQTDSLQCTKCLWDMWPNPTQAHCVPKTQEFLSHEDPLGVTLMAAGISSSLVPVAILGLYIHYRTTPIVRANNYSLSCLLLVSLLLCFLCSLVFIGYPQYEICLLRQVTFGIVLALCVSCILAKTIMVVIAFKATRPGSQLRHWTRPRVSYLIVISCILIQIFLCIMWLTFSPPFLEYKSESNSEVLIIQCNEGSPLAFWSMLGYLGLLASISFIVAFLARRLPDSFNEAKFITFSMLAFLSVWISYIPASLSSRGKYMVAMEIFAIQSSTWGLVICMFLPKCFIIVFSPDMNSRENLMAKQKNLNNK
ncbi:extracellular calcium-sensing receptor-like [Dendropsophus ebraccatus]|uniref:extracellular calcium-sensing receptor-like n=1 Tax=Dendropsophus ebraccatus TaxID=150705 RepID=UPI0038314FEB